MGSPNNIRDKLDITLTDIYRTTSDWKGSLPIPANGRTPARILGASVNSRDDANLREFSKCREFSPTFAFRFEAGSVALSQGNFDFNFSRDRFSGNFGTRMLW